MTLVGFQGGRQDPVTGLILFNDGGLGRDLNPGTGAWNEAEPLGGAYIDGPNLYQFVGGNPVAAVDPTGLFLIEDPAVQQAIEGKAVDFAGWGAAAGMGAYTYGKDFLKDRWRDQQIFWQHVGPKLSDYGEPHNVYPPDPRAAAARKAALAKAQQQANAPDTNYNSTGGDFGGSSNPPKAPPGGPSTQPSGGGDCPSGDPRDRSNAAARRGSSLHSDKPGNLPNQLRDQYPDTEFEFTKPGQPGQDVRVTGGRHPSDYPGSRWPKGVNRADFKPDTPGGQKTFSSDQRDKWSDPTYMIPYDPGTGKLK